MPGSFGRTRRRSHKKSESERSKGAYLHLALSAESVGWSVVCHAAFPIFWRRRPHLFSSSGTGCWSQQLLWHDTPATCCFGGMQSRSALLSSSLDNLLLLSGSAPLRWNGERCCVTFEVIHTRSPRTSRSPPKNELIFRKFTLLSLNMLLRFKFHSATLTRAL
jgi:hypothetical protein